SATRRVTPPGAVSPWTPAPGSSGRPPSTTAARPTPCRSPQSEERAMRFRETLVATAALALVGSIAAEAGILASAPAEGYPGTQTLSRNIVGLQTGPKEVTVEALDYDGAVLARDTLI